LLRDYIAGRPASQFLKYHLKWSGLASIPESQGEVALFRTEMGEVLQEFSSMPLATKHLILLALCWFMK
jgi:hypothetical protein